MPNMSERSRDFQPHRNKFMQKDYCDRIPNRGSEKFFTESGLTFAAYQSNRNELLN